MVFIPTIVVLILLSVISAEVPKSQKYTTKYDNINLEDIVKNDRLLKNYVDCLLEKGNCTPDGLELKTNMPDAVSSDCSKCSKKQKEGSDFIIKYLIDNKPDYWKPLQEKYDPTGLYKKKYLESKSSVNIKPVSETE